MHNVFVHGMGAISPLAPNWPQTFEALCQGKHAIRWISSFDVTNFPSKVAAQITHPIDTKEDRRLALARIAANEAWAQANLDTTHQTIGVFIGAESGRATLPTIMALARAGGMQQKLDHSLFGQHAPALAHHFDPSAVSPATVASALAKTYAARGPVKTISLACASSNAAIAEAARAISLGLCDIAICGGVGADVDPLMVAGFGLLGALSSHGVSCPFDIKRDGFVVGEGAAILILSNHPDNARATLLGHGRSLDAHHLTKPDPKGTGAISSMTQALTMANLERVDYIQAHGTSTPLNDIVEAHAIEHVFKAHTPSIHVSSAKGALGHWIAGAGALGCLCAIESITQNMAPPTANLSYPDPDCALNLVMHTAHNKQIKTALVNAFAFGGANCSTIWGAS